MPMNSCLVCGEASTHCCIRCDGGFFCSHHTCHHGERAPDALRVAQSETTKQDDKEMRPSFSFVTALKAIGILVVVLFLFNIVPR
jgi:hypothetical protein